MSRPESASELERWKNKYFDLSDAKERERERMEEYAALLQRFLVRISLAAEQVDAELDRELEGLRAAVREASPESNDLEQRLKRVDSILLRTDEQKNQNAQKIVSALARLIDQLLGYALPSVQKRSLKKLAAELKDRELQLREFPELLQRYAALQVEALRALVSDSPQEGLFSRWFGGRKRTHEGVAATNPETAALAPETETEDDPALDLQNERASIDDFRAVPGYSAIARHIQGTLERLLEQLVFPKTVEKDVADLRARIASDLNWYELGPTLSDLANLVIAAVGRGQRDFERFLLVLNERLSRVQSSLLDTETADQKWRKQNTELDRVMREHVSELAREMTEASDVEALKVSITTHLDSISSVMDRFANANQQRESEKDKQLQQLQERLANMEKEADDIRQKLKEEREHALTDILTGLPNREAWDERFELEYERWQRYRKPVALVVADVDHFKSINDNYGHLAGDKVLQILAKELQQRIRKTDFLARLGGEEFVILLPETELETAIEVIDKAREMVQRLPFHFKETRVNVTVSFGVVPFAEGLDREALFERADAAMYRAKKLGRNRVERAEGA